MPSPRPRPPAKEGPDNGAPRRNTLGLNQRDLAHLLDQFDTPHTPAGETNREFIRWPFRHDAVRVVVEHAGGSHACLTMACRNVSRGGISLLHSCYMHAGTKCTVMLPYPGRGEARVTGWVARCEHRAGVVHEIGVSFDKPIEVRDLLRPDLFADWYSLERVNLEDLKGNVLYVDDSEMDVRIVKHFLRGSALNVRTAATGAEALVALDTPPDLVIIDLNLPDGPGSDLATAIRQRGCHAPIILVSSDTGEDGRTLMSAAGPDACLAKPLDQKLLLRAVAEFLIVRRKGLPEPGQPGHDAESEALVKGFLSSMPKIINHLESAISSRNTPQARTVSLQIAGTAPVLGFHHLADAAREAVRSIDRTKDIGESVKVLRTLVTACRRASAQAA